MNYQTIFIIVIIIFFNILLLNIFRLQNEIYNFKSNKILPGLLNENMYNFKNLDSNSNVNSGGDILSFVGIGNPFIGDGNNEPSTGIFLRHHNSSNSGADGVWSRLNNQQLVYNQSIRNINEGLVRVRVSKTGNILTFQLDKGNTGTFTSSATFNKHKNPRRK